MRCGDLRGVEPAAVTWGAMAIACGFARNSTQFFLARLGVGSERLAACRLRRHGFPISTRLAAPVAAFIEARFHIFVKKGLGV